MSKLIVYYAHPGHKHSHVNRHMARAAQSVHGITYVDLYGDYPRFDIDVNIEQQRLLDHDVILFQFPVFWYSTPSVIKEWEDLVLEQGFAYGADCVAARAGLGAGLPDRGRGHQPVAADAEGRCRQHSALRRIRRRHDAVPGRS